MVHRVLLPAVLALWATVSNVHAITITEQAGSSYDLCTNAQLASFSTAIRTESDECAAKVTYNWSSDFLPTTTQRRELCTCKSLISKLQTVKVPYCGFYRISPETITTGFYSYKNLVTWAFEFCSASSSSGSTTSTTTTTTTTTSRPTANATPTSPSGGDSTPTFTSYTFAPVATYAPSFDFGASTSSSKKKSKSNTGVIVGIIIALVAVAAVVAFVIYKRKHLNQETGRKSLSLSSVDGGDLEAGAVGVEAPGDGDLSPLGGGEGEYASYTSMPPSPSAPDAKHMTL